MNQIIFQLTDPLMKSLVPFVLFMAIGCILVAGCVTQKMNTNENFSHPQTFTSFTIVGTKGPLKISLEGSRTYDDVFIGEYPVYLNNSIAGVVSTKKSLTLQENVGNYTVKVCCGTTCEPENVTIRFGKQLTVDFSDRLKKQLGSSKPVVHIVDFLPNNNQITIIVELINPTTKNLKISADVSAGYTFIESKGYNRVGRIAQGHLYETVNACDRVTKTITFDLVSGFGYLYDIPTVTNVAFN
jgi:hypothetical protein